MLKLKKDKTDLDAAASGKPAKDKSAKEGKSLLGAGKTGKDGKPVYFWSKWSKKNKDEFKRPSAIPKQPMSKQDKIKLIVVAAIVVLIPVFVVVALGMSSHDDQPVTKNAASK